MFRRLVLLALLPLTARAETYSLDRAWRFHDGDPVPFSMSPAGTSLTNWSWQAVSGVTVYEDFPPPRISPPPPSAASSVLADPSDDVFHGERGQAWFTTTLPALPGSDRRIWFSGVDDDAAVFLNGKLLTTHRGWNEPFTVSLDPAWNKRGRNLLQLLVGNAGGGPGHVGPAVLFNGQPSITAAPAAATGYDDTGWQPVNLPHDFVVGHTRTPTAETSHGFIPKGRGWYRKTFELPVSARGQMVRLEFDGIYRDSAIWLNGRLIGTHLSGYTSFTLDATAAALPGRRNVLAVRCDAEGNEGWWYEGGGIYRHVRLVVHDPVHVAPGGVFVTTPAVTPDSATIRIATEIRNDSARTAELTLVQELTDPRGRPAGRVQHALRLAATGATTIVQELSVDHPIPWHVGHGNRYAVHTGLYEGHRVADAQLTRFGIRKIAFDPEQGFLLNDIPTKLNGTCNHQDFAGVGIALPDRIQEYKIEELQRWGSNAYRCSHHPPSPELLEACDRLGMLVMDENRHLGDSEEILSQVESMVRRDRNHPSIVIWSTCNEEWNQGTETARKQGERIRDLIRKLDGTRPVTSAMNQRDQWGKGLSLVEDVQGTNYNPEGYDEFHKQHPQMPMISTESHSTTTTRGIYFSDSATGHVSSFNGNTEYCWKMVADRPFVAGTFVWTGFDYRGEPTPYEWPCVNSHFGFLDTCGFPKDDAFYYKAHWKPEPTVHVFPHWNPEGKDTTKPVQIRCYGNTDEVELFVNGKSAGRQSMPPLGHVDWRVNYKPGAIEVWGINKGATAAIDRVETTGEPDHLALTTDRQSINADGQDVALIRVSVMDKKNRIVPTADNRVTFQTTDNAAIIGVGNGDPSDHDPDQAQDRRAFNGRCLGIMQSTRTPGPITVKITSPGLIPAVFTLTSTGVALPPEL